MYGGLNRLLAAAFVAGVALVGAPTALACSGGPSAYNVYHECLPNGGSGGGGGSKSGGSGGSSSTTPSGGSHTGNTGGSTPPPPAVSKQAKKAISHAGPDGTALKSLYNQAGRELFLARHNAATPASQPTAIGSAFDLGSGPTVLLIGLAGTAVLLLAMTGVRGARRRR